MIYAGRAIINYSRVHARFRDRKDVCVQAFKSNRLHRSLQARERRPDILEIRGAKEIRFSYKKRRRDARERERIFQRACREAVKSGFRSPVSCPIACMLVETNKS